MNTHTIMMILSVSLFAWCLVALAEVDAVRRDRLDLRGRSSATKGKSGRKGYIPCNLDRRLGRTLYSELLLAEVLSSRGYATLGHGSKCQYGTCRTAGKVNIVRCPANCGRRSE